MAERQMRLKACKAPECGRRIPREEMLGPMREFCSPECGFSLSRHRQAQQRKRKALRERREIAVRREKLKTRSDYIREAQQAVNAYVRARDHGKPCISCGGGNDTTALTGSSWDAGHYRSRGAAPHLRFHLLNIWRQCTRCNRELSGNVVEFRKGLVEILGESRVQELEHDNSIRAFDIEYLKRMKRIFRKRERYYRKRRGA